VSADRPRVVIVCDGHDGKGGKPHRPVVVALYAVDSDGTLLPIHSAIRDDGKPLILPESGLRPVAGQFDWPCPRRGCTYRFRHPVDAVGSALLRIGRPEVSLRELDRELRHAD
jgi:hypothetical protein